MTASSSCCTGAGATLEGCRTAPASASGTSMPVDVVSTGAVVSLSVDVTVVAGLDGASTACPILAGR